MKKKAVILIIAAICAVCLAAVIAFFSWRNCSASKSGGDSQQSDASGETEGTGGTGGTGGSGGQQSEHVHNYGELIPEQPATCTQEGLQAHYYCSGCQTYFDDQKHETTLEDLKIDIDSTAHNYGELVPQVDAQCEVAGTKAYYHCEDCGKYFDDQKVETEYKNLNIPAKDHNYGQLVPQVDAQCEVAGTKAYYHCEDCGKYFDDQKIEKQFDELTIPAKNHNYGELIPEQPATCTEEGLQAHYHCVDCNKYFNSSQVETDYEDLKIDVNPNAHKWGSDGKCLDCQKQKPAYTESDDHAKIYFGEYPQSEVTESGLKATLGWEAGNGTLPTAGNANGWTDYNYYIEGEVQSYMWYIDVEYENNRYRGVYFTSYRPRQTTYSSSTGNSNQDDNGYEINTVYWFKYEPIEWRILEQKDGTALLMSNIILDSRQYYHEFSGTRTIDGTTVYPNNYKESDIRAWLNDNFYNTAFDELAKSIIQLTEVDNSLKSTRDSSNGFICENTNDNVFLLSREEITTTAYGFISFSSTYDTARQLKSTAYAKSQGVYAPTDSSDIDNGWWWLRSPDYYAGNYAYDVSNHGDSYSSYEVNITNRGVVPALWIKL